MEVKAPESESARSIRQEIASFLRSKSNLPVTAEHATEKLLAKSLDLDEISRRREAFSTHAEIDSTAVLANYELLHGVKYLDRLINCEKQQIDAKCIVAIFRGTEICLNNISVLADRIIDDISHSRFGDVSVKISWMNHFNDSLYRFSQLLVQTDLGRNGGDFLSIEDSSTYQAAAKNRSDVRSAESGAGSGRRRFGEGPRRSAALHVLSHLRQYQLRNDLAGRAAPRSRAGRVSSRGRERRAVLSAGRAERRGARCGHLRRPQGSDVPDAVPCVPPDQRSPRGPRQRRDRGFDPGARERSERVVRA